MSRATFPQSPQRRPQMTTARSVHENPVPTQSRKTAGPKGGKNHSQTFGAAILGLSVPSAPGFGLARLEDQIAVRVQLFTDSNGGEGRINAGTAKTSLSHNGIKPDEGTCRAEMEHSRDAELSKKVSGAWTFKAKHTTETTHFPLTVVRFAPRRRTRRATPAR